MELDGVEVRTPAGEQLIDPLDLRLERGESMVITGSSGSGKTTLLRSLAELWPAATRPVAPTRRQERDDVRVPAAVRAARAISARWCRIRPSRVTSATTGCEDVLGQVSLPHLRDRLDEEQDWAKVLSPGEQQRIAFARVLLTRPKAVFLDEATSALDEGLEAALYRLLRTELPETIMVSVAHHATVEQHHQRRLELLGGGGWRLGARSGSPNEP